MAVIVGSARIDEHGSAHGGKAGDQTGKEVSTQNWYAHSKGWVLLRAKDPDVREKIAKCMETACRNSHIGYDQYQRDSLYNAVKDLGFDVSKLEKSVETDCSALVRVCVNYAGIPVGNFRTTDEAAILMKTGAFDKYTDALHCKKSTNLLRGDILVTRSQGHTVVVLNDGSKASEEVSLTLGCRILRKGSTGTDVRELQEKLVTLEYNVGSCGIDGDFGKDTKKAVKAFQKDMGLEQDGEYGPLSHAAMMKKTDAPINSDESDPVPVSDAYPVHGLIVDISDNQGAVDMEKLAGAVDYVIARSNMGKTKDKRYKTYAADMDLCNIPYGAYLFTQANTTSEAIAEADLMLEMTAGTSPTVFFIDVEGSKKVTVSRKMRRTAIKAMVSHLREKGVKRIGLYTGEYRFKTDLCNIKDVFDVLWIANWGKNNGTVSKVPSVPCMVHQYTSMGRNVPGIPGRVDLDREGCDGALEYLTGRTYAR